MSAMTAMQEPTVTMTLDKGIWTVGGLAKDESKILKITVTVE